MISSKLKILFLLAPVCLILSCTGGLKTKNAPPAIKGDSSSVVKKNEPVSVYGFSPDSFDMTSGHIKKNGFLSEILLKHGIKMQEIDQVIKNSKSVFDVRKMRSGNDYMLYCDKDSNARARYLVYEHDPTVFYVFSFNDSLNITAVRKEIKSEIKYSSGTIQTSLWDAMKDGGFHPALFGNMSDIFAWTIDFFGLQKGDNFKVIYEEFYIDGKPLGSGRIYAAQFNRKGSSITAIPFIQDGKESYFDVNGNSLKKAFLKAPLQFSRITSHFSAARMHPILRVLRPHYGVDYAAPIGTPVHSIGDGRVTSVTDGGGEGKMVRIQHNSVYATSYMHLSGYGEGIRTGALVKQGDIVGYVGSSGLSTGPHLDFRIYMNGSPVDPLKVDAPPVEPVREDNKASFEKIKSVVLGLIDTIE